VHISVRATLATSHKISCLATIGIYLYDRILPPARAVGVTTDSASVADSPNWQ